jgi:protein-L-isoaspartate(D-aspartate) O-methyltransferase
MTTRHELLARIAMSTDNRPAAAGWRGWPNAILAAVLGLLVHGAIAAELASERQAMVEEVAAMARAFDAGAIDPRVLASLGRVPRHEFVPLAQRASAYENRPLSIGHGQTISQPYIVAVMTDLLKIGAGATALEIGTGSGYQAAVLADLGVKVATIEIVEPLAREAAERLQRLGYRDVATKVGDGYHGWAERAPFDAIVVTAAASHVPPPLVRQLKPGGRMVIPVGPAFQTQHLLLVVKDSDGTVTTRQIMPVRFVPLTGSRD